MSSEEKTIVTPEAAEPPKPKRRFKLDKKHIQGFIAGILLCAIAFTGLYYGTDGRFLAGTVSGGVPVVTDANFESVLDQPDRYIIVASSNYIGNNATKDYYWRQEIQTLDSSVRSFIKERELSTDILVIYELDPGKSENVIKNHFPDRTHYAIFYNGQKLYTCVQSWQVSNWISLKYPKPLFIQ